MAAGGGGAWKVAYADFVTAMMAFFLVMWITSQDTAIKEAIAHHFNDPFGVDQDDDPVEGRSKPRPERYPKKPFSKRPAAGHEKTTKGERPEDRPAKKPRNLLIRAAERTGIGTVVFFTEESTELTPQAKDRLKSLLPSLVGKPHKVEIRGHSSRRPPSAGSGFQDVWQLSYARCIAVMAYLQSQGVQPEQMRLSQAGGSEPLTIREDAKDQAHNPRVEVVMLDEWVQDLVGTSTERAQRVEQH